MDQITIQRVVEELKLELEGHFAGRVFQLSPLSLAVDFGAREAGYLFISVEPAQPRIYLIKRRSRDLERHSIPPLLFAQAMRSMIVGGRLIRIEKDETERVVRLEFAVENELGETSQATLVAQLTGRAANLFLLDANDQIRHALRPPKGEGQGIGERYQPPPSTDAHEPDSSTPLASSEVPEFATLSATLDHYYLKLEVDQAFAQRARIARDRLKRELAQRLRLKKNLERDLTQHGDPEQHKRRADLLLANVTTAQRSGNQVTVKDYYADGTPELTIELDENSSLQDEAARCFALYTKAKRAHTEIARRRATVEREQEQLQLRLTELEKVIAAGDTSGLALFEKPDETPGGKTAKKQEAEKIPGVRRYQSTDGYEILVGRAAQTNDRLTFKIAKPHDIWLHAADYPGSHVVVRNQTRREVPHRTIIEAAQLAAKFSQAGEDSKVTVHYTSRKFLTKPKGAAPGLVRMSSFKTIRVKPGENISRS